MKKLAIHFGLGLAVLGVAYPLPKLLIAVLDWFDTKNIAGASWLSFATWELAIGTVVIAVAWAVCLFALPFNWGRRFQHLAPTYVHAAFVLLPGAILVGLLGVASNWLYGKGVWLIGAPLRLFEVGGAVLVLIGLAFWLYLMGRMMLAPLEELDDDTSSGGAMLYIGVVAVVCLAARYFTCDGPSQSASATPLDQIAMADRSQLETYAMAVVGCIHCSASDDPQERANYAASKDEIRATIAGLDESSQDAVCSLVDDLLRVERSLHNDMVLFFRFKEAKRTDPTCRFELSDPTRRAFDRLSAKLREFAAGNIENAEALNEAPFNAPTGTFRVLRKNFDHIWAIQGETYAELLGRPMPSLVD